MRFISKKNIVKENKNVLSFFFCYNEFGGRVKEKIIIDLDDTIIIDSWKELATYFEKMEK